MMDKMMCCKAKDGSEPAKKEKKDAPADAAPAEAAPAEAAPAEAAPAEEEKASEAAPAEEEKAAEEAPAEEAPAEWNKNIDWKLWLRPNGLQVHLNLNLGNIHIELSFDLQKNIHTLKHK